MKILLLVDKYNWAYDSIAQNLLDCNPFDWDINIMAVKKDKKKMKKKYTKYDFFFVLGWQNYDAISFSIVQLFNVIFHYHQHSSKLPNDTSRY